MCSNFPFFQIVFRNLRSAPPKVPVAFRARRYNKNLKNEKAGPFLLLLMTTICPNQFSTVPFFCLLLIAGELSTFYITTTTSQSFFTLLYRWRITQLRRSAYSTSSFPEFFFICHYGARSRRDPWERRRVHQ